MKPFYIKGVNTFINPMQYASLYHAAGTAHVVMANGSDYVLTEEEYANLLAALNEPHEKPHDKPEHKEELVSKVVEAVQPAIKTAVEEAVKSALENK